MSLPQQPFTFRSAFSPPPPPPPPNNPISPGLCTSCSTLDLQQHFSRAYALYEGARRGRNNRTLKVYRSDDPNGPPYLGHFYFITSLGTRLSRFSTSNCKLCSFLLQTMPDIELASTETQTYKLLAICCTESYLFEPPKKEGVRAKQEDRPWGVLDHNIFMAIVPDVPLIPKIGVPLRWLETGLPRIGSIYRVTQREPEWLRLAQPRELGAKANYKLMKMWLESCRTRHVGCGPKKPTGASLRGFRAIDCTKPNVVGEGFVVEERPWSAPYVALSYVWGTSTADWPQTILDAVEVTKRLGQKYLWVDRLCIDQKKAEEKQFLISKMDAIYEGAEFTIVCAEGDATSGLPGVLKTPRKLQPRVELDKKRNRGHVGSPPDQYLELIGISEEEYLNSTTDREWLDLHRFGVKSKVIFDAEYMKEFEKEEEIMAKYDISSEHLKVFQDFAEDFGHSIDDFMEIQKKIAQGIGIPMKGLVPHLLGQMATRAGVSSVTLADVGPKPTTDPSRPEAPLPKDKIAGKTILVSTLPDPRVTIRNSDWATRGWTYQEGVLSNRRLVFTAEQVYWECAGMAANESLLLLGLYAGSETHMADYMLAGIFDADLHHRVPELSYGFRPPPVSPSSGMETQMVKLDAHIRAFTSRKLSFETDSLNAFLGVAARYSSDHGLHLLLGMPVWAGAFANGKPGLQDTFACSLSAWTHASSAATKPARNAGSEMYVVECPRRVKFPSWTWAGWTGRVDFSTNAAAGEDEEDEKDDFGDAVHVDFFKAMTSTDWAAGIARRLWSAEMLLHASDGSEATLLVGHAPVVGTGKDQSKTWLLTVRDPMVLKHRPSAVNGEWHLSVGMTEAELMAGHRSGGGLMTVLVFVSTVPFVYNVTARFLILRKVTTGLEERWERIGRLAMTIEESELDRYGSIAGLIAGLPVRKFGTEIVLI